MSTEYDVLNEDVDMRLADLDGPGTYLVEVTKTNLTKTRAFGSLFEVQYTVLESDHKGSPVGAKRSYKVFDCFGAVDPDNKGIKIRNMRGILAALSGVDPTSKQDWAKSAQYASEKNVFGAGVKGAGGKELRNGRGVLLAVKVDAGKPSKRGKIYYNHSFTKAEEQP